jgi:tetratricopeptide (TPR) repeat protein
MASVHPPPYGPALSTLLGLETPQVVSSLETIAVHFEQEAQLPELATKIREAIAEGVQDDFEEPLIHMNLVRLLKDHEPVIQGVLDGLLTATEADPDDQHPRLQDNAPKIRAAFFGELEESYQSPFERPNNPIDWLLRLEEASRYVTVGQIRRVRSFLKFLLASVKARLNEDLSPEKKLRLPYWVLERMGYLEEKTGHKSLFTENVLAKTLDCDDSCLAVLAIAHEMQWPVSLVIRRDHTILRWDDGETTFNMDFGIINPDSYYENQDPRPLRGLTHDQLQALFYFNLGLTRMDREKYEEAIPYFKEAICLYPDESLFYVNRGVAEYQLEFYNKAIERLQKALTLDPYDLEAQYYLGMSYFETEQWEDATRILEAAMTANPEDPRFYFGRALIHYEKDEFPLAITLFQQALALGIADSSLACVASYHFGLCYFHLRQYDVALKHLEEAWALDNTFADALYDIGLTELRLGHKDRAREKIQQAIELDAGLIDDSMTPEIQRLLDSTED